MKIGEYLSSLESLNKTIGMAALKFNNWLLKSLTLLAKGTNMKDGWSLLDNLMLKLEEEYPNMKEN